MWGAIKTILGSGDVMEKGFNLIDSIHDSDTEIVQSKAKAKIDILNAYHPFKKAQRYLALLFGFTYTISFSISLAIGLYNDPTVETVTQTVTAFKLQWVMLTIVGFYFGGGVFEGGVDAVKKYKEKKEGNITVSKSRPIGPTEGR